MVCFGDLESYASETASFPIPLPIAPFEACTDHPSPFSETSLESELHSLNRQDCSVDHLSALLHSEIAFPKVHPIPGHLLLEQDSLASSLQLDLRGCNQHFVGIGTISDCFELRSNFAKHVPPLHVEMVKSYQAFVQDLGTENDRASISRLIRYALSVRGVKMLDIRYNLHHWYRDWVEAHGAVPVETQKDFAFHLIESEWYEDKLAAVLFIQEVLIAKQKISFIDLRRFEEIFRGGHIKVYKVCDHFASKILCHLVGQGSPEPFQRARMLDCLFQWAHAEDSWQARAAMFALAHHANNGICQDRLMNSVQHILTRPEEEAKSMAGAVLRSISEVDPVAVVEFLNRAENIANISTGALDKATSRLSKRQQEVFKNLRKELS